MYVYNINYTYVMERISHNDIHEVRMFTAI